MEVISMLLAEELIRSGCRLRGRYLVEQSNYTRGLLAAHPPVLDLLEEELPGALDTVHAQVETMSKDRVLARQEAKDLTGEQNRLTRELKSFRRETASFGRRLARSGLAVPAAVTRVGRAGGSLPALLQDAKDKVAHLGDIEFPSDAHKRAKTRAAALVKKGNDLVARLEAVDTEQELAIAGLPPATREYYRLKGLLYVAIKQVNDAAQEAYDDPSQSAAFNLKILHRRGGQSRIEEVAAGAAEAASS